jgi:hypothetical protein
MGEVAATSGTEEAVWSGHNLAGRGRRDQVTGEGHAPRLFDSAVLSLVVRDLRAITLLGIAFPRQYEIWEDKR